ncbi:MAG: portal protein [gamma proteobacterium symbiont of Ctena orbiculata]|uniref:Cation:proton antiporter n=1 Tax=Candidatus Thiodiazotropha taylori TaxID=2792791 RepID=A0A944M7M9_9GAMM|nr:cation:proton antiporter [Candidatus Thiodiazotropha taylori]PUB81697.1 MAG: portal protein [gamma proteobacterium symbiont of Ctena orbiculata]MBT3027161.1 cation:proton antiporter [Candidatus Thiodiazotropha taylori]MBT3034795.1 cation:proton antiporter [Candidatus Thiodiazotropha taylori]MBV2137289.1 cation:proton antiporter [Candidatus Thiodiazotropha taylori]
MHLDTFLFSALLLLLATSIAVTLFKHLGLGSVLGLLVAGIIVGPHSPGPYVTEHVGDVRHFTELGVVLLLFIIGLEMRPKRLWALRREAFGLGLLQILVTGLVLAIYFYQWQSSWPLSLLIGVTFALSSTAFVIQILQERGEIASKHGMTAFSILLMQDLAIVPLLALVPIFSETGGVSAEIPAWQQLMIEIGMIAMVVVGGRYLLPMVLNHLAKQGNREGFLLVVMLAVFLAAWVMDKVGLSMALGAFVMGMLLSGSSYRLQIQAFVEPYKGLLMSLFFVAVGMSIDFAAISQQLLTFVQHVVVIVLVKLLVLFLLALGFGVSKLIAMRISFFLAQGGEFGFVLFAAAKALDVIDDGTFVIAVGVISVTMLITPLLIRISDHLARQFDTAASKTEDLRYSAYQGEENKRVVIGGYGRVGHTVAVLLHTSGVPVVVFDTSPERVAQGKQDGLPVYYGDISDPDLLDTANLGSAALLVLTVDSSPTALRTLAHARNTYPHVPVVSRARDLETVGHLLSAGASHAFPEALESSLRLGAIALQMVDVPQDNVDLLLQGVRQDNYTLVKSEEDEVRKK